MKNRSPVLKTLLVFAAAAFLSGYHEAAAQGTALTYHGIEMPVAFTLYVAREKTGETLTVLTCAIPKRSYAQYVAEQTETSLTAR